VRALKIVDFPAFGNPMIPQLKPKGFSFLWPFEGYYTGGGRKSPGAGNKRGNKRLDVRGEDRRQ
jgi:hypothetical protein